jgi:hypothetical protein
MRKPVLRMLYVEQVHSDDEYTGPGLHLVCEKPGRNPVVTKYVTETLDIESEVYRKRHAKCGQKYVIIY